MELKIPERRVMQVEQAGQPVFDPHSLQAEHIGMQKAGRQLAQVGTAISDKALQAERVAKSVSSVNEYRLEMDQFVQERGQRAGDYASFETDFSDKQKELFDKTIDSIDDETVKASVSTKLGQLGTDYQLKVRHSARKQQIGFAQISTTKALSTLSRAAVESGTDYDLDTSLNEMRSLIEVQTNAGIYTPETANRLLADTRNDVYTSRIKRDMAADPEQTYHDLLDEDYYPELPEDKRATLTETARKRMETKAKADARKLKKTHTEEDRLLKIRQDKTSGFGYSLLQENELDEEWLETMRENRSLKASDYTKLKDSLNNALKKGGVTDPSVYYAAMNQVYGGAVTIDMLYRQVGEGLTYDDVKELQTILQEGKPIFKTKEYQEARSFVRESMGITGFGFMKESDGPKVASASRELYERVKNGSNPMTAADDIIGRYNKRQQGLPSTRAYPDIPKVDLLKMLRGGMITTQQYNTEVGLIEKEAKRAAYKAAEAAKQKVTE